MESEERMRLIDADALMKIYGNRMSAVALRYSVNSSECGILAGAMKLLEEQPTIQPTTAHWIIDGHHIQCSHCEEYMCDTDREGDPIPRNFCPNCGVRMVTE